MMLTAAVITLVLLPIYVLVREPFRSLPLHIDTGFYVSNHAIVTGRWDFSRGWNAHFAGCTKVLPEWFYTSIYLLHGRRRGEAILAETMAYKKWSRLYASIFNYATAVAVGALAYALAAGDVRYYCAALVAFVMVSSEPHYGIYFECAELFEMFAQTVSMLCILAGLAAGNGWCVCVGAFLLAADAFFIKLSSAITVAVVFIGVVVIQPGHWLPMAAGGATAAILYGLWLLKNGRALRVLLPALRGHEASFAQGADWRSLRHRLSEKCFRLVNTARRQPVIPLLAILGILLNRPGDSIFWIYLAGLGAAYLLQAADCRYYLLPFLPAMAVLAAGGIVSLSAWGTVGGMLVVGLLIVWIVCIPLRAIRLDAAARNRWCWDGSPPAGQAEDNLALEQACTEMASRVAGKSLLVYGPANQAYVLLGASYATPIVAPEYYLDDVCPGWQRALNEQMVASPPAFILDTSRCFDAGQAHDKLSLDYRLAHKVHARLRLYELKDTSRRNDDFAAACTFSRQTDEAVVVEEREAGGVRTAPVDGKPVLTDCPDAAALAALLRNLAHRGYQRLALYGAGRFTLRHADLYRTSAVPVALVLDDNPVRHGRTFLGWPVRSPEEVAPSDFDAVVISSDRFRRPMLARLRRLWGDRVPAFTVVVGSNNL